MRGADGTSHIADLTNCFDLFHPARRERGEILSVVQRRCLCRRRTPQQQPPQSPPPHVGQWRRASRFEGPVVLPVRPPRPRAFGGRRHIARSRFFVTLVSLFSGVCRDGAPSEPGVVSLAAHPRAGPKPTAAVIGAKQLVLSAVPTIGLRARARGLLLAGGAAYWHSGGNSGGNSAFGILPRCCSNITLRVFDIWPFGFTNMRFWRGNSMAIPASRV